jgi:hypothetical protein
MTRRNKREAKQPACAVAALALQADRYLRAEDHYKEAERQAGELACVPNGCARVLWGIESYALTLRAQSDLGAWFQAGIILMGIDSIIDDLPSDTERRHKKALGNMVSALSSVAGILRNRIDEPLARRVMEYYNWDVDHERLERALAHADTIGLKSVRR